ncbi:hypothetical protein IV102_26560 [bacterium]|nr:hypothetical protein [bacterium]
MRKPDQARVWHCYWVEPPRVGDFQTPPFSQRKTPMWGASGLMVERVTFVD